MSIPASQKLYSVFIGGIEHAMQYDPETAERLGLTEYVSAKPRRTSRSKIERDAELLGVEVMEPTANGETTPGDVQA